LTDALNRKAIDVAWTGVEEGELDTSLLALQANSDFITWQGATGFSSSLVMVHDQEPWDNPRVREAVSLAVDRVALADTVFSGTRLPLYQPIPDSSPGHLAEQPPRDLVESRRVLTLLGYSENNPVEINIAYVNDGRYSSVEGAYAAAIKSQLEETGMISVTVEGAPWDVFRNAKSTCAYNSFLQGWPSPGQAVPYIDGMSWLYFFLLRTDSVCSNYESTVMDAQILALEGVRATDADALATEYANIQTLWAEEFPSIPLTQAPRYAVTLPAIQGVVIDAMGILHYDLLEKSNIDG
jgi:peptide/nickel transport system substrate-binding protein